MILMLFKEDADLDILCKIDDASLVVASLGVASVWKII